MTMIGADASPNVVKDGTDAGFMADVIEESRAQPVIVDFWAPWCGPCKTLAPALEKAVKAAKGKVKLVKINIDENPAVAGQLGVRSIPAVFAFDRGRPVDGFMGAVPESQLRMFVDKLANAGGAGEAGDDDLQAALTEAATALKEGDVGGAAQIYAAVLQADPENVKAIAGLARCYLLAGEPAQAADTLALAPADKAKDPDIVSVRAAIELTATAKPVGGHAALEGKLAANPDDHAARFELANALAAGGDLEGAVTHLLAIIEKDRTWNEDAARTQLLKVFEAAGLGSELSKSGRRRLSALLFS